MPVRLRKRALWLIIVLVVLAVLAYYVRQFLLVDKCLDAGGLWDYRAGTCDMATEP